MPRTWMSWGPSGSYLPVRAGTMALVRLGSAAIPALGRGQELGQGGLQDGN